MGVWRGTVLIPALAKALSLAQVGHLQDHPRGTCALQPFGGFVTAANWMLLPCSRWFSMYA